MSTLRELADTIMAAALAERQAKAAGARARAEWLEQVLKLGTRKFELAVEGPDGEDYGPVFLVGAGKKWKVTDPAAYLRWVIERHPEHIEQIVRAAYTKALLEYVTKANAAVDPAGTGELVPGVELEECAPTLACRPNEIAHERAAYAWSNGSSPLTLPAAPSQHLENQ